VLCSQQRRGAIVLCMCLLHVSLIHMSFTSYGDPRQKMARRSYQRFRHAASRRSRVRQLAVQLCHRAVGLTSPLHARAAQVREQPTRARARPCGTGAGGDNGIAKMWNRR
jgi:hypothetical protein